MNKEIKEKILIEVLKKIEMSRRPIYEQETNEFIYHIFEREFEKSINLAIEKTSKHYEEKLTQTNLRNHSREQKIKKAIEETEKNIIESIKLTIQLYPHKHGEELFAEIQEQIIKKHFNSQENNRKEWSLKSAPDNQIPPSQSHFHDGKTGEQVDNGIYLCENPETASGDSNSKKYTEEEIFKIIDEWRWNLWEIAWAEDQQINNKQIQDEINKLKHKIVQIKHNKNYVCANDDCDCKMFIGGSGKLCPDCEEEK